MALKKTEFEGVPNVQACLAEIRNFLNDLSLDPHPKPKWLPARMVKAHHACNELIKLVDPNLKYYVGDICPDGLPRRSPRE